MVSLFKVHVIGRAFKMQPDIEIPTHAATTCKVVDMCRRIVEGLAVNFLWLDSIRVFHHIRGMPEGSAGYAHDYDRNMPGFYLKF
jgi:hypothetical protein